MFDGLSSLTEQQLKAKLCEIGRQCRSESELQARVNRELPGVLVNVGYCGPMFMGLAMSHGHPGAVLSICG